MTNDTLNSVTSALELLEEKQQLFVHEYIKDLNGTKAAIRAHYAEDSAHVQASRMLSYAKVQNAIAELKALRNKQLNVDAGYVLQRLLEVDQLDVLDILDKNNNLLDVKDWPPEWRRNVSQFEVAENSSGIVTKLKFPDKVKNLELIGRHIDVAAWMTNQTIDHTSSDGSMSPPQPLTPESAKAISKDLDDEY